jgi:hypothetical protein
MSGIEATVFNTIASQMLILIGGGLFSTGGNQRSQNKDGKCMNGWERIG